MYNNDSDSLNAGAPDIRLTGNQEPQNQQMAMSDESNTQLLESLYEEFLGMGLSPKDAARKAQEAFDEMSQAPQQNSGIMAAGPRGTYTQRRRTQMAGGGIMGSNAGSMLVAPTADGSRPEYGVLDKLKRGVSKLIPNELKNIGGAALAATAANYLPVMMGGENTLLQKGIGAITKTTPENNALDYMRNILGGSGPDYSNVTGVLPPSMSGTKVSGITGMIDPFLASGAAGGARLPQLSSIAKQVSDPFLASGAAGGARLPQLSSIAGLPPQLGGPSTLQDAINMAKGLPTGTSMGTKLKNLAIDKGKKFLGLGGDDTTPGTGQDISWKTPMAIGAAAGAYQKKYLEDQPKFAEDTTGIDFQTAQQAMADPNLRFKPEAQYANVAEGGRIGYERGRVVRPGGYAGVVDKNIANLQTRKELYPKEWTEEDEAELQRQIELKGGVRDKILSGDPVPETEDEGSFWDFLPFVGKAQGGRIGYAGGADYYTNLYSKYAQEMIQAGKTPMPIEDFVKIMKEQGKAQGGRIGAQEGGLMNLGGMEKDYRQEGDTAEVLGPVTPGKGITDLGERWKKRLQEYFKREREERPRAAEGGLMNLGGMEKDYRQEGGFVPLGGEEKADDVPARLSKNEFVFTADAVRNAGGGDIDAGAEVMENLMENLEAGGEVSEDSQGLEGARGMFANAQELEKRII